MHSINTITQRRYQAPTFSPFGALCEQHVDDVVTFWGQWQVAMDQPMYDKDSLKIIESKIRANIAGTMSNSNDAWVYVACLLKNANPGEVFAAAQIAFRSYKTRRVRELMEIAIGKTDLEDGLVSALAWLPQDIVHPWLRKFLKSKDLNHKTLALRSCRLRGETPHKYLSRFLKLQSYTQHRELYIQSLRIVGELKIFSERDCLYKSLKGPEQVRFWGLYSLVLLGEHELVRQLNPFLFDDNPYREKAIDLTFRVLPLKQAWDLINELKANSHLQRQALQAISCLGDPAALPWVLEQMKDPILARASGEAFYNITGININSHRLCIDAPYSPEELINIDPEYTAQDIEWDEHLPWPDAEKIWLHWHNLSHKTLVPSKRYLLGNEIKSPELQIILDQGKQRQRRAAALELALHIDSYCLYSTRGLCTLER